MAWSTPKTWTTGELVTAAQLNAHLRDNLNVVNPTAIQILVDGGGAAISTGSIMDFSIAGAVTVSRWEVYAAEASSVQFEIYSVSYAGFPAGSEDSINSGSTMNTSSARTGQDTNPSAFGTMAQGEVGTLHATAVSGVTKATVAFWLDRD